ncbi:nodulation protein NfeD [Flammeovirgaceae bacterium KN852]|uniref:Nodulation protein NfeD n=2 Tax=Marinigracilibium pacificum TaxID=2729599 RepID=A0A848JC10_9BACT|nr:nodulation protein NfeD [Marinigracilibium pacificum]NMM50542.1 nodulation protein NfeD [Marinigracilibium pacificum]
MEKAVEGNYSAIILELDTYGGLVTDANDIRERILKSDIPVYAFINTDAASAGALISIACDSIYMAPGSAMGAATVVVQTGEAAPDKYQSYMRKIMRSTAEERGRDPIIAEGMVDESIEIDSITTAGKVITFSTKEALKYNYCEAEVTSYEDILERTGLAGASVDKFSLGWSEKVISWVLNPVVSGFLILIMIGGIYYELQTPGVGFPIAASILAAVLYFIPYYLNGLAENWEILLFGIGIILLALEIFVIPGFGVAGVSGLILIFTSLTLVMLDNDTFNFEFVNIESIVRAMGIVVTSSLLSGILMIVGGFTLYKTPLFNKISLAYRETKDLGYTSKVKNEADLTGKNGIAYTVLRPSGKVSIGEDYYDAYTRGEFISKGQRIVVIRDEGSSLLVKAEA